ncbi:hypothetical protein [Photobacterium galatheae]|uniref:Uncharacterized protein n=1 Tax=Photobacterium galatheae TaxID=1654360 RepID=A0A066RN30_9GAMM|nr:hypothetical protein [Photobacterium galatheae]KDM91860.1 hypothetical protein EA58_09020 [Photobacterium galatheae]MCM0147727.1 hypothetical protein [Photobacterium galatheae]
MRFTKIFLITMTIIIALLILSFRANEWMSPVTVDCPILQGKLQMGEEVTTFHYDFGSQSITLTTSFNQSLQKLGMPPSVKYKFTILSLKKRDESWHFHLREQQSNLEQTLVLSMRGEHYGIQWANDHSKQINYQCMVGKNAEH